MNILIVDDSSLVRERVAKSVSEIPGMIITGEANNSIEAFKMLRSGQPHVMILDIKMPGESGIDVLRKVKENYPLIKVIMLTNYPFLQYRSKCYESGADFFLDKSVEFEKLNDILIELNKNGSN